MTTNLERDKSRSDRGEAADSRREPAQIGAAVEDCPAYAAAVLACSLLFSLYAFPLPATPQLFQLFNPSFPPGHLLGAGRLPNLSPSVGCPFARFPPSSGSAALAVQLFRRLLVVRRRARPDTSQSARGRCCARSAKILANWLGLKNTHSQGLVILSGHYFRTDSRQLARSISTLIPQNRDPIRTLLPPWLTCGSRGKENLQRSIMGAAFCALHSDTSSCGRTGMQQASSLCAGSMQY